jgi:secretory carrier-associated membrane protein
MAAGNPFASSGQGGAWGNPAIARAQNENEDDDEDSQEFSNPFGPAKGGSSNDARSSMQQQQQQQEQRRQEPVAATATVKKNVYEAPTSTVARDSGMETFGAYGGAYDNSGASVQIQADQQKKSGGLFGGAFGGAFGGGGSGSSAFGGSSSGGGGDKSLAAQRKELEKREADIARRERELASRESALRSNGNNGQQVNNWPFSFWAIAYHNIEAEIPPQHQRAVRVCYYSYVTLALALFANLMAVTGAFVVDGRIVSWLVAIIYFLAGIPGAYFIWYRRLYMAAKNDSGLKFGWFFLMYLGHLAFMVYACISPSGTAGDRWSLAGVMVLKDALKEDKVLGGFYALAFSLFVADAILSIVAMRLVWTSFRAGGHSASAVGAQMGAQAASGAASRSALRSVV